MIRQARITDVDRLYALCAQQGAVPGGDSPIDAIGLLRQLVYIPNASVAIAEAGRQMVGGAILGLRPSVRNGGFVGTIDLLVVADGTETDKVADLLIEEMLHSARRKGCAIGRSRPRARLALLSSWQGHGFRKGRSQLTQSGDRPQGANRAAELTRAAEREPAAAGFRSAGAQGLHRPATKLAGRSNQGVTFVSKNVAVFVDVANIFYAAKAAGADIDYVTLLKAAVAGRDFVRAYAYTGLDPDNENQRNFHSFLARHGYKVVSKDIRKYGDGKVKANLDIELVVDMMKTARNLDVAIVVSGDGDFAPAIRAVQEMGVRVEVISFRGNTSSDLIEVADAFYDITQLARSIAIHRAPAGASPATMKTCR